jgi:hypothetical protein
MQENAGDQSTGRCANFCRRGLEAGGFDSRGRPTSAGDYGEFLTSRGANRIESAEYEPQAGDIVVFGKTARHPHGHIAIFDGQQWISDFKQRDVVPYRDRTSAGPRAFYRFPEK